MELRKLNISAEEEIAIQLAASLIDYCRDKNIVCISQIVIHQNNQPFVNIKMVGASEDLMLATSMAAKRILLSDDV